MKLQDYKGWGVYYVPSKPVTGRWIAIRFGVEMCAGTEVAIKRMIDTRPDDSRMWPR